MKIFKRLQRHIDAALPETAPAPYTPRTTVQGGKLPVRYVASRRDDATLAKAARREVLADVYFRDQK